MDADLYAQLTWLPQPDSSFSAECRSLPARKEGAGPMLQGLANHGLNVNQLMRLAKAHAGVRQAGVSLSPLTPFRLGVLSNSTLDFIVPSLEASALRHGITLECLKADYGQVIQEALSPVSSLYAVKPDAVLVAVDLRYLPIQTTFGELKAEESAVEQVLSHFEAIRDGIRQNSGAITIFQTLAPLPETLFGSLDSMLSGASRHVVSAINKGLADKVRGTEDLLVDVAGLAETVGLANWHSVSQWNLGKFPFADEFVPIYAEFVTRVLGALRGKSRRCLILDLDNTVWGGVIGDDGLESIKIAQGDSTGEAHLAVQRMALSLRERGVVLAVSSKNNDDVARLPFREHPEMLLREDHIAVFQANWRDKATNITAIAEELSLGLDAMVFLDDNPVERGLVRQMLPQVAVPELSEDPALYARTLAAAGYFEAIAFSGEDAKRAEFYQDNARRVTLQKQAGNIDAYLESLNMEITFQPFDKLGRSRIAQLISKSNQYNLTTRRYTEAEVADAEADPNCFTLQIRLSDTFGDNGMISVVICRLTEPNTWEIDTWLMSCRVLGRGVQAMVLKELLHFGSVRGITRLIGVYKPTDRNKMVAEHYSLLGFSPLDTAPDGSTRWILEIAGASIAVTPMQVKYVGFDHQESAERVLTATL